MLNFLMRGLDDKTGTKLMTAAAAVCVANAGDGAAVAAKFADDGWTVSTDSEMGETSAVRDGADVYVMLYQDGAICDVISDSLNTGDAIGAMQILAGTAGLTLASTDGAIGCDAYQLAPGITVEITSAGQDPICFSETDSTLRFTFGDAQ